MSDTHEEAHAAESSDNILIQSDDTDVFVFAVAMSFKININLFMHMGLWSNSRTVNVQKVATDVGENIFDALIGIHCFTDCDSVSCFKVKGKVKGL